MSQGETFVDKAIRYRRIIAKVGKDVRDRPEGSVRTEKLREYLTEDLTEEETRKLGL